MTPAFQFIPKSGPILVDQLQSIAAFVAWLAILVGGLTVIGKFTPLRRLVTWWWRRFMLPIGAVLAAPMNERRRRNLVAAITPVLDQVRDENSRHHEFNGERLSSIELAVVSVRGELIYVHTRLESLEDVVTKPSQNGESHSPRRAHQP